jgi:3'-5' exoribonuclease
VSGGNPALAGRRRTPRAFCGDCYPWPLIEALTDGLEVAACYIVREKRRLETRQNKPYLKLVLGDGTGEISANIWDEVDRWDPLCPEAAVIGVHGRVSLYQDRLQLRVQSIELLEPEPNDVEKLLPSSPLERAGLEKQLDSLISSVKDAPLRSLLRRCLGKSTALGAAFREHPAAKRNHHAYLCGLLEHSVSVASLCSRMAGHYQDQGLAVDRDLLVTGALLHDIGKLRELSPLPNVAYTTEGQLLGHILIGLQIVAAEAAQLARLPEQRLLLLQHLIASHQGRPEWDSPKVPQLVEALILHYADDLDAKLNQARGLLSATPSGSWSAYDRSMERSFFRPGEPREADDPGPGDPDQAAELLIDLFRS